MAGESPARGGTLMSLSSLAAAIDCEHRAALSAAMRAIEHAANCGRHLLEAKDLVPHGTWLDWVTENTEVGFRQSQKYMRLAQSWHVIEKRTNGAHLSINGALAMIAKQCTKPKPEWLGFGEIRFVAPHRVPLAQGKHLSPSDIEAHYAWVTAQNKTEQEWQLFWLFILILRLMFFQASYGGAR
jgi:hypothetical protein